jgi:N-acetylmuramoyl-L-alanine amidase/uncharacterized protein YjlB
MATSPSKEFGLPPETEDALGTLQDTEARTAQECVPGHDALQALLAFSSLHDQIRQKRERESHNGNGNGAHAVHSNSEQYVLYEVLQVVAERALALTGADGIAIALVQDGDIICRAATGHIAPEVGAKLDPHSGFSGACLRSADIVRCDDAEKDERVNLEASRKLNTRSMVAVPLRGRRSVIGLLEAFSTDAYGFNDSDVRSLTLLAELILGAMKPEEQEHFEATSPVPAPVVPAAARAAASADQRHSPITAPALPAKTSTTGTVLSSTPTVAPTLQVAAKAALPSTESSSPEFPTQSLAEPQSEFHVHGAISEKKPKVAEPLLKTEQEKRVSSAAADLLEPALSSRARAVEEPATEDTQNEQSAPALFSDYREESSRPGLKVVIGLVAAAILAAVGLGWRLQNSTRSVPAVDPKNIVQASPAPPVATPTSATVKSTAASAGTEPAPENVVPAEENSRNVFPLVTGIRHWESVASTTVVIDLQDAVQYEVHRLSSPERIYFDLHDTVLAEGLSGRTLEVGGSLLLRIRVAQPVPGISRVVLETKDVSNFSVSLSQNPNRLSVEIRGETVDKPAKTAAGVPNPFSRGEPKLSSTLETLSKEDLQLRARVPQMRIVIDAGHGGWDLGTAGRNGLLEKNLVLDISQRLAKLLQTRLRSEVILTREDDTYIPLEKRTEIANNAQADLFVSVHANYSALATARGIETYFTNFSVTTESSDIEKRENATAQTLSVRAESSIMSVKERTDQSRKLAASVERALYATLAPKNPGLRDRGVKEASFVVLTGTSMPAILAEVSFVSSPADEQNLQSTAYRQKIAEALYKGIGRYAANSHPVKMASNSTRPLAQ